MTTAFWLCDCRRPNTKVYYADEIERLNLKLDSCLKVLRVVHRLLEENDFPGTAEEVKFWIEELDS